MSNLTRLCPPGSWFNRGEDFGGSDNTLLIAIHWRSLLDRTGVEPEQVFVRTNCASICHPWSIPRSIAGAGLA